MASIQTRQNKNGSTAYVVRVYVCRNAAGKTCYLSKTYTPKPGTSEAKIQKTLKEICAGLEKDAQRKTSPDAGMPFAEYVRHFLEKKALVCSEYTMQSYRLSLRKACEFLGNVPLKKLTAEHLDLLYVALKKGTSQYGKPYSDVTIHHIQILVRMVLGMAVREGLLAVNAADRTHYSLPHIQRTEPVFLELEEARAYIRAAKQEKDLRIRCMVLLLLYTGIRMEELCGLEWKDIDFPGREIHIRRASVYISGKGVITKSPKTFSGMRTVSADASVFAALHAYRKQWEEARLRAGMRWTETDRLFTKKYGGPLIPSTTENWLRRFAAKHGLRPVTPHKLRHTYATLQISYGTDIRTVAGSMGHSSAATTLTIYAHQVKDAAARAALAMSEMLAPRKPGKEQQ